MSKRQQPPMSTNDEEIVDMYWQRDPGAIQKTDQKYGSLLLSVAHNILFDFQDCEECQNDTYLQIWNSIPSTRPTMFSAFITRIARCIAIRRYEEKSRQKRVPSQLTLSLEELEELSSGFSIEEAYEAKEIGKLISEYVKQLDERQRYIFVDHYFLMERVSKTAFELGISDRKVYYEVEKIKKSLREYLKKSGVFV